MIRVEPCRRVMMAVHTRPSMRPMTTQRGSSCVRAGTSRRSSSSHSAFASAKSIPCFFKFEADLPGSNSNHPFDATWNCRKGDRNYPEGPLAVPRRTSIQAMAGPPRRCTRVEARKALRATHARQPLESRSPGPAVITFKTARPGVYPVAGTSTHLSVASTCSPRIRWRSLHTT